MNIEFEEKDFEAPLYNELCFGSHRIATPGQVFEGRFGIDAALEAEHPLFWDLFGYYDVPKGVILENHRWGFMWKKLGRKRRLPTFSTNLLIQAKRPEVLTRSSSILKQHGFHGKYWRFKITSHQQEILEKVAQRLNRKALVIYASPAFDTLDNLYDFTDKQNIVENTSFVKIEKLKGHEKWNYYCSGSVGVAHSDPEYIEDVSFEIMIRTLYGLDQDQQDINENLHFLHDCAVIACQDLNQRNPIARYYLRLHNQLMRMREFFEYERTLDYAAFNLFCNVVKLKWLVV